MNTIDFGIDLGTTNSAIARFVKGEIEVFKGITEGKNTLPSVVRFFRERPPRVGDKARESLEKDPRNVFSSFKRKMGTTETFKVEALGRSVSPIELSSLVLKELKSFVHTGEVVSHAVITIPASFDTIQSNATKQAGIEAGFKTVELLQEPIAASLAYANKTKQEKLPDGQWLVYDLGGGTFDVAIVKTYHGEMRIVDHEGDNFLGGSDFDALIAQKLIIPYLERVGEFADLETEMKSAAGKYGKEWFIALHKAEEAKIELSSKPSSEIEIQISDDSGEEHDLLIPITRTEFEEMIKPAIDQTVTLIKKMLTRNSISSTDLEFILMVGGSTYIPFVRSRVAELLQVEANCNIDPTTAIVIGAAYFAGTRTIQEQKHSAETPKSLLKVKVAYQKASQDEFELFSARITGDVVGKFYRITREDGGFDTGLRPLAERISEDLPLVADSYNFFTFQINDDKNNPIPTDVGQIGIAHGKYSIAGQPVPHDICLLVDDIPLSTTKQIPIFLKNTILPVKRKYTFTASRTVQKGSEEDIIHVIVQEGSADALPESNWKLGHLKITGKQIPRDVLKGADIEIEFEISESRDLAISAYIPMINAEYGDVFKPKQRHVSVDWLIEEMQKLEMDIDESIEHAEEQEDYLVVKDLKKKKTETIELIKQAESISSDDVTDSKFQLEDKKRKLAQQVDDLTKDKRIKAAKAAYQEEKGYCLEIVGEDGNDYEKKTMKDIIEQESVFLASNSVIRIDERREMLRDIRLNILWRSPGFLVRLFKSLLEDQTRFNNQEQAQIFIEAGKGAIQNENFGRLAEVNNELIGLLPKKEQEVVKSFTGLSL